jgi:hypothetical protein
MHIHIVLHLQPHTEGNVTKDTGPSSVSQAVQSRLNESSVVMAFLTAERVPLTITVLKDIESILVNGDATLRALAHSERLFKEGMQVAPPSIRQIVIIFRHVYHCASVAGSYIRLHASNKCTSTIVRPPASCEYEVSC